MIDMIQLDKFLAGHYEEGYGYKYFVPNLINDAWEWKDSLINHLLEKAALRLGELNSFSRLVPNIDLFIQLHVTKEAVISSRIEGTQTRMDEALLPENEVKIERRDDWKEVRNYIKALNEAISCLEKLPISSRLIKTTHRLLAYEANINFPVSLETVKTGLEESRLLMPSIFRQHTNW